MADFSDELIVWIEPFEYQALEAEVATLPTISVVSPTPGTVIRADQAFTVDVTGASLAVIVAELPAGGPSEVVWVLDAFAEAYADSSRAVVPGGYRYEIRRRGGWRAAPRFRVEAAAGLVAV